MSAPMPVFTQDFEALQEDSSRTAKFYRVALHCHSPQSHDWARSSGDPVLNNKERYLAPEGEREFLKEIQRERSPEIIAITDHMKCSFAARLAAAAREAGGLIVIPGMEVSFRASPALGGERLHLVVLLPENSSAETFGKLLDRLPEEAERTGREELEDVDLRDFVRRVRELDGVCIAAHVENNNGVRFEFRQTAKDAMKLDPAHADGNVEDRDLPQTLRDFMFSVGFSAVEIKKPADRHHYRWTDPNEGRRLSIPTVLGYDSHCIEDLQRDDKTTLVKMTESGLSGLRSALQFAETRVRFPSDVTTPPSPRIEGLTIAGGADSFFLSFGAAYSPNLNCMIGPRGSGKSTLVEAMRYVLGYNRTLSELDPSLSTRIEALQNANLGNCRIRLYYRTAAQKLCVLEATFDAKQEYATRVFDEEGTDLQIADVEKCGDFPVRLYGWSEIEILGRDQSLQRALLDRMIKNLAPATERRAEALRRLAANRISAQRTIRDLTDVFASKTAQLHRYVEFKSDFEKLNTADVQRTFSDIDAASSRKAVIDKILENLHATVARLSSIKPISLTGGTERLVGSDPEFGTWLESIVASSDGVMAREQRVSALIDSAISELDQLRVTLENRQGGLADLIAGRYADVRKLFADNPDQSRLAELRTNAKKRLDEAARQRSKYMLSWVELGGLLDERREIIEQLVSATNEVTGIRETENGAIEARLNQFTGDDLKVSIRTLPGADRSRFKRVLDDFLRTPGTRVLAGTAEAISVMCTPVEFADLLMDGRLTELMKAGRSAAPGVSQLSEAFISKFQLARQWSEQDPGADVPVLKEGGKTLQGILTLQEIPWDDAVSILLNDRPVDKLSPGQRSSAMLPLIALAENTPLVIDQPEDNLDNRLVGNVLVNILAELKAQRQIIVCTHNPNIVVSGDAEQVVVLEAEGDRRGKKVCSGSIDNEDVVSNVIALMEGGKEAFLVRKRRYRL